MHIIHQSQHDFHVQKMIVHGNSFPLRNQLTITCSRGGDENTPLHVPDFCLILGKRLTT